MPGPLRSVSDRSSGPKKRKKYGPAAPEACSCVELGPSAPEKEHRRAFNLRDVLESVIAVRCYCVVISAVLESCSSRRVGITPIKHDLERSGASAQPLQACIKYTSLCREHSDLADRH